MDNVDELLDRIEDLPPAPRLLPRLLSVLSNVDIDISMVVDLISFDPALTAKIVRTCNSAFFAGSRPADDVGEAVSRLGFQTVYRAVAVVVGAQCLRPTIAAGLNADRLWRHCVNTAFAAQFVATDVGEDSGLLFTAGLLHDLGKFILVSGQPARVGAAEDEEVAETSVQQERAQFGVDHAEVGGRLLERWKFSPLMVASVRFHHNPSAAGEATRAAACIGLADTLAHNLERGLTSPSLARPEPTSPMVILGVGQKGMFRYQDRLIESARFVEAMCRL